MTSETVGKIDKFCDRYGDKLIGLMEKTDSWNLQEVPEQYALAYLKELEDSRNDALPEV